MLCAMVILNYRDRERAAALAIKCASFETIQKIVIVDNKSQDGSFEELSKIQSKKIEVIQALNNAGFASGNNEGAQYIVKKYHPKYIFFANTDTIFPEKNIVRCMEVLEADKKLGLVSTKMIGPDGKDQIATYCYPTYKQYLQEMFWVKRRFMHDKKKYKAESSGIEYVDIVRGSFMFFRTEALIKAGFFDEKTFLYCEETIIAARLKKAGYCVGVISDCSYIHDHWETKDNQSEIAIRRLYESRYYYAKEYIGINCFQKAIMKIIISYSLLEFRFIFFLKKFLRRG